MESRTRKLSIYMEQDAMDQSLSSDDHEEDIIQVDDDIIHTVTKLMKFGKNGVISPENIETSLCKLLQAERNQWKDKTDAAMNQIERQHKEMLANQVSLQNLMDMLHFSKRKLSHTNLKLDNKSEEEKVSIEDMLDDLKYRIINLKQMAGIIDEMDESEPQDKLLKYSDRDIEYLKNAVAKAHWEKETTQTKLTDKENEVKWLTTELDNVKMHLRKLQDVVKKYNEVNTGANFHLNEVKNETNIQVPKTAESQTSSPRRALKHLSAPLSSRQRTYVEGDWLKGYPNPLDESAAYKARLQSHIYSSKNGNSKMAVAQCLRCQKLFKPKDNSNKSCRFHPKGREITEQYDVTGKLAHVVYKWACCRRGLDSPGCSYGHHV